MIANSRSIIFSSVLQWLGFGPEELKIPDDFEIPVSSFAKYGGHMALKVVLDSRSTKVAYRAGDDAPGNNIAFLQGEFVLWPAEICVPCVCL